MKIELEKVVLKGDAYTDLGNEISDAVNKARLSGISTDEICCVIVSVAADYARGAYGTEYLEALSEVVVARQYHPMPKFERIN